MIESTTLPMPGTMGSATLIFDEEAMKHFTVTLDVKFIFDVDATNMDDAAGKARHFFETMKHSWGENMESVTWHDHYITKQSVSEEVEQ
jgi:hypothetical protein